MSSPDPGVPYGSAPDEASADAEPTSVHETVVQPPAGAAAGTGAPPPVQPLPAADASPLAIPGLPADRPELHIAAAFAGGFVLALILKRLAR